MNIVWLRRDLRLEDNTALIHALSEQEPVLPLFIFDTDITGELPKNDHRINFIYQTLKNINDQLLTHNSSLLVLKGKPHNIFEQLLSKYPIKNVYANRDYEPYARKRDKGVKQLLLKNNIELKTFKDHVIFEPGEILKADKTPYTVYTPFKNTWLKKFNNSIPFTKSNFKRLHNSHFPFPTLKSLNFEKSEIETLPFDLSIVSQYHKHRDIPSLNATSNLGAHLRFGTLSIRQLVQDVDSVVIGNEVFLSELIWREFFAHIIFHFPHVVHHNFKKKYDGIIWRNNNEDFKNWCNGTTGYPIVDAGMRQLNETGYMHNRVRMITAGFLCKHLLIDWKWGEAYFASKLLDFDLASNNGNWQWSAGTGCDAAPYFRIFNPTEQVKKFDPQLIYIKKWVKDLNSFNYPSPIVEHKFARNRALEHYKKGILTK